MTNLRQGKKVIVIGILIVFAMMLLLGVLSQSLAVMIGFLMVFAVALPVSLLGSRGTGTGYSTGTGALSNYPIYNDPRDLGNIRENAWENR